MADAGVALVTGASRGLGAATPHALARDGFAVALNYASADHQAARVQEQIRGAGGTAELFPADVTDDADVVALHTQVVRTLGEVDVLVVNATGRQPDIALDDLAWRDVLDQLEFFVKSPLLLAGLVVPAMRRQGYGRIVQIGSEALELGTPGSSAYVAAKGAQLGLTRSWARELATDGITVNLVAPGWIPTERHDDIPDEAKAQYNAHVPVGRLGAPTDVAEAVAYLASDHAGFITGQRISVNGGRTLN